MASFFEKLISISSLKSYAGAHEPHQSTRAPSSDWYPDPAICFSNFPESQSDLDQRNISVPARNFYSFDACYLGGSHLRSSFTPSLAKACLTHLVDTWNAPFDLSAVSRNSLALLRITSGYRYCD